MRISLSLASLGRPKRTIRSIESICNQTINGWEALVVGDGCPVMEDYLKSNYFKDLIDDCEKRGNVLDISNLSENSGGYGYHIINLNIQRACGKYFIFYANDDVILPNHFENYLSVIENTDYDFAYFNSLLEPLNAYRIAELKPGYVGHSELIIKTDFLKKMPPHTPSPGHDWELIDSMIKLSNNGYIKSENSPTYIVKRITWQGIDRVSDEID